MTIKKTPAKKKKTEKVPEETVVIKSYKGFDKDMKCRGFQYKVGKTYIHNGVVSACNSGFHSCENPFDVLNYYDICNSRFAEVTVSGKLDRHADDSKIASGSITIAAELKLPDFIKIAIVWMMNICKDVTFDEGYSSQLAASGNFSQLAASGYSSQLAASGYSSQLAASGNSSQLAASGDSSIAMAASPDCKVKVGLNGAMALTRWVESEKRYRITLAFVGENGIKADTWYTLDNNGLFVEEPE